MSPMLCVWCMAQVLGSGVIQHRILQQCAVEEDSVGWAFGLGLERLAMV